MSRKSRGCSPWLKRQIEHVDARRGLPHDGLERAFEQRQTPRFDFAQVRDRLGALGVFDPRPPDRGGEVVGFGA